ncbi:MAG: MSHA biogenesis protein MshP [Aquabacterium sp.]|jgi:MSHA biogenesis protein MshP|uniref:MSHA biogenesis protein MshP n=1 Tax=Aquabacterium sp. TaxID=1872578 RepID=UPI003BAF530B
MNTPRIPLRQKGLGALAAVIVLVLLAGLAAAVVRMGWTSQMGVSMDVMGARARLAANAGADWGLFQAFRGGWQTCTNVSQTLDLRADTGMFVTVTCRSTVYSEGQDANGANQNIRVYNIFAVACNGSSACPDNSRVGSSTYVERERLVQATDR